MKKLECQRIVKSLKRKKGITYLSVYTVFRKNNWVYYYSIHGFLNGNYFNFYLHYNIQLEKHVTDIPEHVNCCKDEIEIILKKFNLL